MKQILLLEDNEYTRNKLIKVLKSLEQEVNVFAYSNHYSFPKRAE